MPKTGKKANRKAGMKTFENFPCSIVLLSNLVSFAIYLLGSSIIVKLGVFWLLIYLLYIVVLEIRLLKGSCANCYYYGKICAFGKGKLSALLFKNGISRRFVKMDISWKDILPDFLISLIPSIFGVILLILKFDWLLLLSVILLLILSFAGNGFIRSNLACKFCKQKKRGCPAKRLFNKKKK